jgi:hypothetical protein
MKDKTFLNIPVPPSILNVLIIVGTLVALLVLLKLASRVVRLISKNRLSREEEDAILREVNELDSRIHEFEKRVETLEDLASGYYSSLMGVPGFTVRLQTLAGYRDRLIQLLVDVEALIEQNQFAKTKKVLQFLNGSALISAESIGSIVLADEGIDLNGWEKRTTPLVVQSCADLEGVAGEMAKIRMIDPNRKRKPTLLRLQELRDRILFQS